MSVMSDAGCVEFEMIESLLIGNGDELALSTASVLHKQFRDQGKSASSSAQPSLSRRTAKFPR